ncbi:MAG: hypothetical protein FWG65_05065 [Turicibacter sp.]|nr:hypothetical protein [Turicibacter sp.]
MWSFRRCIQQSTMLRRGGYYPPVSSCGRIISVPAKSKNWHFNDVEHRFLAFRIGLRNTFQ